MTVITMLSSGYSCGSGTVGFDALIALNAALVKASTADGCRIVRSVTEPSLWIVKRSTVWPCSAIAAYGISQLRYTCARKRRSHDPKSTPLLSNWNEGPKSEFPCTFCSVSPCEYFCTLRIASLSTPGARFGSSGLFEGSLRAMVDCEVVGSASALGFDAGGAVEY